MVAAAQADARGVSDGPMSEYDVSLAFAELLLTALERDWTLHSSPDSIKIGIIEWHRINPADKRSKESLCVIENHAEQLTSVQWKPRLSVHGYRWMADHWELEVRRVSLLEIALSKLKHGPRT